MAHSQRCGTVSALIFTLDLNARQSLQVFANFVFVKLVVYVQHVLYSIRQ